MARASNIGYHGENPNLLQLPLDAIGLGMNDRSINLGMCAGGEERMSRILRMQVNGRVDPTPMTTHRFSFDQVEHAFEMLSNKTDNIIKPLITF